MANITVTTADVFLAELWAADSFDAAEFAAVVVKRINRKFESVMSHGDTLHIPVISNLTANNKSAGTDVTFEAITETDTDVTIATHKYAAFKIDDIVKKQANQDLRKHYTDKIGYALNRAMEVSVTAIFDNLSVTVGTLGQELTWDDYRTGWQKLAEVGVGEGNLTNDCSWMLSKAAVAAAFNLDVIISRDYRSSANVIETAKIPTILDIPVFSSNLLESDAAGQHDCAVFHRDQFVFIQQLGVEVESDRIIESIADAVVGHCLYGFAETLFAPETAGGGAAVDTRGVYLKTV